MRNIKLKDKASGCFIWIAITEGKVVGALGSDPQRYMGLTEAQARHLARYGGIGKAFTS